MDNYKWMWVSNGFLVVFAITNFVTLHTPLWPVSFGAWCVSLVFWGFFFLREWRS